MLNSKEVGIYVHIPFCKNKCYYCDYSSLITKNNKMIEKYFKALFKEIDLYDYKINKVKTIYIGGGTPSLISFNRIEEIVKLLKEKFDLSELKEFTIEMNPENVNKDLLKKYKDIGINRISLGVQNLNNDILNLVNRKSNENIIEKAVKDIKDLFDNYNLDFILGLPGENLDSIKSNIEFIKKFNPPHISYYIYDNNHESILNRMIKNKKITMPLRENIEEFADMIYDYFEKNGYKRYEISSWAIFDKESLHNKIYWENSEYIGFGVSAGGYYNSIRYVNTKNFSYYIQKINNNEKPYDYLKENTHKDNFIETLFMGFRLIEGIPLKKIKTYFPDYFEIAMKFFEKEDYFEIDNSVKLSKKGIDYSSISFEKIFELEEKLP